MTRAYLIVCPLVFLAGLVDAIGGGGGLISLPSYMIAGLPPHAAVATNKLANSFGTCLATVRFHRNGLIDWKLAVPGVICAIIGAGAGSNISLLVDAKVMEYILYMILPVSAILVLNKNLFRSRDASEEKPVPQIYIITGAAAFIIGMYDGFYGPGTGTFLIIAFTIFARMNVSKANAQSKVINLTTNITSLVVFLKSGQVWITLGLAAAACNMAGNYIGAGLAMKSGEKVARPVIIFVLFLLLLKVLGILSF